MTSKAELDLAKEWVSERKENAEEIAQSAVHRDRQKAWQKTVSFILREGE